MSPDTMALINILSSASPVALFAIFIIAMLKGWLVLPREVENRDNRIKELVQERDEYKELAFRVLNVSEKVADVRGGNNRNG